MQARQVVMMGNIENRQLLQGQVMDGMRHVLFDRRLEVHVPESRNGSWGRTTSEEPRTRRNA